MNELPSFAVLLYSDAFSARLCWILVETSTHLAEDDLRRQVLWGSTQSPGPALHPFGESKIRYLKKKEATLKVVKGVGGRGRGGRQRHHRLRR